MTFEYRDPDGGLLRIRPLPGISAVLIETGPQGCAVPADRMPDVVAGARDTTRTAARQTTGQTDTDCPACEVGIEHTEHCPTPETHNWGCGCPTDEKPRCLRCAPAIGQPTEAQPADRAAVGSVSNVIEHALTAYYQDSSAPSAVARALLAQHQAAILNAAADALDESETLRSLTDDHMHDVNATTDELRRMAEEASR